MDIVRSMRRLFVLLPDDQRRQWLMLLVHSLFLGALEVLGAWGIYFVAARFMADTSKSFQALSSSVVSHLDLYDALVILVAIFVVKVAFQFYALRYRHDALRYMHTNFAVRVYKRYIHAPFSFLLTHGVHGSAHSLIARSSSAFHTLEGEASIAMTNAISIVCLLGILLVADWRVAIAVFTLITVLMFVSTRITRRSLTQLGQQHDAAERQHIAIMLTGLEAAREIKALGREDFFVSSFQSTHDETLRAAHRIELISVAPRILVESLFILLVVGAAIGALTLDTPTQQILPLLGLHAYAGLRILPMSNRILDNVQKIRSSLPAVEPLLDEYATLSVEEPRSDVRKEPLRLQDRIVIRDLSHTYEAATRPALSNVSLTIHRGQSVAITGETGAGKTTLLNVLLGFITPTSGVITIDGEPLAGRERRWWRSVGYVPQEIYLGDLSIRENVAFGVPRGEIDDLRVESAIQSAQLDAFIGRLDAGLDTAVGERGVRLSGGERQRLGIARALYERPSVLLLDEATAALDLETEEMLLRSLMALECVDAIVLVTHRMTAASRCDRVVRLHRGRIEDERAVMTS